jgi:hypothetical protein
VAVEKKEALNVYQCIALVSAELAQTGISKDRNNAQQGYKFRGIDDVYNAIAPIIAKHGLVILPRILSRAVVERTTQKGGVLFYVTVEAEFDFVSAAMPDSRVTVRTYGEAMDSGDKATNKAMSAAYKYAAFQTFCIPTEGENDADATTHQVAAKVPEGYEDWLLDLESCAAEGTEKLKATWLKSKAEYRQHMTTTANAHWEGLKTKAAAVKETVAA